MTRIVECKDKFGFLSQQNCLAKIFLSAPLYFRMKVLPVTFQNHNINLKHNKISSPIERANSPQVQQQPSFTGLFNWFHKDPNLLTGSQARKLLKDNGFTKDICSDLMLLLSRSREHILGRYHKDVLEKSIYLRQQGVDFEHIGESALTQDGFLNFTKRVIPVLEAGYPKDYLRRYIKSDMMPNDAEKLLNLKKIAQEKREQLSYNSIPIIDKDIDELFFSTPEAVIKSLKIMGQKDFVHSFSQKYDNVWANIEIISDLDEGLPEFQELLKLTNPAESDEYLKNQAAITTLKKSFSPNNKDLMMRINSLTVKNRKMLEKSLNNWEDKLDLIYIFQELQNGSQSLLRRVLDTMKSNDKHSKRKLDKILNKYVLTDSEGKICKKINFIGNKYLKSIFSSSADFWNDFLLIVKSFNHSRLEKSIDIFNEMPMNKDTQKQFRKLGIDYKKWVRVNPHSNIQKTLMIGDKNAKPINITIQKADMNNVEHSLFLGNHSGCCAAVGTGCNDWTAPAYVVSKMISAIEVKAGDDFVGNTMCYLAEIDGKPALILDNIELKAKYQYNNDIRDMIFSYARKLTEEIGKPDMKIYSSPNRHKVDMSEFPLEDKEFRIIGNTGDWELYLDFDIDSHQIDGSEVFESMLFKIQ